MFCTVLLLLLRLSVIEAIENITGCRDNPYYQYEVAPIHRNTAQILSNKTYQENSMPVRLFQRYSGKSEKEYFLYYINQRKNKPDFIICTSPKSSSTRLKILLKRMLHIGDPKDYLKSIHYYQYYNPIELMDPSQTEAALYNESIPRYILVRNPYIRAISMYLDKAKQYMQILGFKNETQISWENFVENLYNIVVLKKAYSNEELDRHFVSQSTICRLDVGMRYNYVLKSEYINDWFDCFIDDVDAREDAMHGWPGQNQCYLSTTKTPCNGPEIKDGVMTKMDDPEQREHNKGSHKVFAEFYKNKTIAKMISGIYKEDIINFQYLVL